MVELTAECDAITDAYSLRAKKFSVIGEDNVYRDVLNSVFCKNRGYNRKNL